MRKIKNEKGITLVALVVTIVVLLILAGITINFILGPNSIFDLARKAGEETNQELKNEMEEIGKLTNYLAESGWENYTDGSNSGGNGETPKQPAPVESIKLDKTSISVRIGKNETLTATIKPDNYDKEKIEWTSSDDTVATVTDKGVVTGLKKGTATITVFDKDDEEKSSSCTVTVVGEGEYAEIPYTWEELGKIAEAISNDSRYYGENINSTDITEVTVTVDEEEKYLHVGDWKRYDESNPKSQKVRILGFNHDELSEGEGYEGGSTSGMAGVSFEFVDCLIDSAVMDSENTNENGWKERPLYKTLNTDTNAKYKDLHKKGISIKQVQKTYNATYNQNDPKTSKDYLWLLSCSEIWGDSAYSGYVSGYSMAEEGKQYAFYAKGNPKTECDTGNPNVVHYNSSGASITWLRSPKKTYTYAWVVIDSDGSCNAWPTKHSYGVAPGFSI